MDKEPILKVENLELSFSQYTQGLKKKELTVITNLDLELREREILAVVGSSGSGKSLLAHAILGILPYNAKTGGKILYQGKVIDQKEKERLRGQDIVLIPQSVNYLDPLLKVKDQIAISLKGKSKADKEKIIDELLIRYGLDLSVKEYYPFQLSGGMARKVLLATALISSAKVIIADEPTPGLDEASLQEVLKDFRSISDSGKAILMITHDINAALKIADKIAIFYAGATLEIAETEDFKESGKGLRHPYTLALCKALPGEKFEPIEGTQPLPNELPDGCLFSDRCSRCTDECKKKRPDYQEIRGGKVRCIHAT
ncbi:MAG: ABC transporter ATP-binding protein [Lachnospiraceae bacterium]|nr:ABC transporter ATP-binding protein [Lachnospiraceae bacterium]